MIDLRLLRDEKTRELVKKSERNRFKDDSSIDKIYELDKVKITLQFQMEVKNKEINNNQREIKDEIKKGLTEKSKETTKEIAKRLEKLDIKEEKEKLRLKILKLDEEMYELLKSIGNILDERVPICKTEEGNVIIREYPEKLNGDKLNEEKLNEKKSYFELMKRYTNSVAGSNVFGHRGYFLQGKMAQLATALKCYGLRFLNDKKYLHIQTPVMMKKDIMMHTAQLSDFDEQLYKVEEDLYLIATSEQPLSALNMNKHLQDEELPLLYCGESLCFRKEAGAYGKDNSGIFRVHQFEKVEQFVICKPEDSQKYHDQLISISEEFYKSLKIPHRVVSIASGEFNDAASMKYDLEAYFPHFKKYRELCSVSNCTDYQSRNLNIYYGYTKEKNEKPNYVHMLNGTLCAVQRTLCCIVENYQDDNGKIQVPEVLRKYVDFDEI